MKSQISFEYILIIGVVLMISLPSFYILRSYLRDSSDSITLEEIEVIAERIISTAKEASYKGVGSRITVAFNMPAGIEKAFIAEIDKNSDNKPEEHILAVNISTSEGSSLKLFDSQVPIMLEGRSPLIGECLNTPNIRCKIYTFYENETSQGIKNLKFEAKGDGVHIGGVSLG